MCEREREKDARGADKNTFSEMKDTDISSEARTEGHACVCVLYQGRFPTALRLLLSPELPRKMFHLSEEPLRKK